MTREEIFIAEYNDTHEIPFEKLSKATQSRLLRQDYYNNRTPLRTSFDNAGVNNALIYPLAAGMVAAIIIIYKLLNK